MGLWWKSRRWSEKYQQQRELRLCRGICLLAPCWALHKCDSGSPQTCGHMANTSELSDNCTFRATQSESPWGMVPPHPCFDEALSLCRSDAQRDLDRLLCSIGFLQHPGEVGIFIFIVKVKKLRPCYRADQKQGWELTSPAFSACLGPSSCST